MHPMRKGKDRKLSNCVNTSNYQLPFLGSPRAFRTGPYNYIWNKLVEIILGGPGLRSAAVPIF